MKQMNLRARSFSADSFGVEIVWEAKWNRINRLKKLSEQQNVLKENQRVERPITMKSPNTWIAVSLDVYNNNSKILIHRRKHSGVNSNYVSIKQ